MLNRTKEPFRTSQQAAVNSKASHQKRLPQPWEKQKQNKRNTGGKKPQNK